MHARTHRRTRRQTRFVGPARTGRWWSPRAEPSSPTAEVPEPSHDECSRWPAQGALLGCCPACPCHPADWTWWDPSVPVTRAAKHREGSACLVSCLVSRVSWRSELSLCWPAGRYRIVLFTNQAGVAKKNQKLGDLTGARRACPALAGPLSTALIPRRVVVAPGKVLDLSKALGFPIQVCPVAVLFDLDR
jgi:hypothetical protein